VRIREHPSKISQADTVYVVWICGEERVDDPPDSCWLRLRCLLTYM
jgi:hypothetical protein